MTTGDRTTASGIDRSTSNDTTLTLDTDLQLAVAANTSYVVDMHIVFSFGSPVSDLKFDFDNITLTRGRYCSHYAGGFAQSPGLTTVETVYGNEPFEWDQEYTSAAVLLNAKGMFTVGGSSGTFGFRWAQNTSTSAVLTRSYRSYIALTEI